MICKVVVCDSCGTSIFTGLDSNQMIKRFKRKEGWTFGKKDLCPRCCKKKGEQKIAETND